MKIDLSKIEVGDLIEYKRKIKHPRITRVIGKSDLERGFCVWRQLPESGTSLILNKDIINHWRQREGPPAGFGYEWERKEPEPKRSFRADILKELKNGKMTAWALCCKLDLYVDEERNPILAEMVKEGLIQEDGAYFFISPPRDFETEIKEILKDSRPLKMSEISLLFRVDKAFDTYAYLKPMLESGEIVSKSHDVVYYSLAPEKTLEDKIYESLDEGGWTTIKEILERLNPENEPEEQNIYEQINSSNKLEVRVGVGTGCAVVRRKSND